MVLGYELLSDRRVPAGLFEMETLSVQSLRRTARALLHQAGVPAAVAQALIQCLLDGARSVCAAEEASGRYPAPAG